MNQNQRQPKKDSDGDNDNSPVWETTFGVPNDNVYNPSLNDDVVGDSKKGGK